MDIKRLIKHLWAPSRLARRRFGKAAAAAITAAIAATEKRHTGELRFVAEGPLPIAVLWRNAGARQRAAELFARLRVWDTEGNSGILIYVQLVDRRVEILADRGIAAKVAQAEWDAICRGMEAAFKAGDYRGGALAAIEKAGALLVEHFPAETANPNELPDAPVLL